MMQDESWRRNEWLELNDEKTALGLELERRIPGLTLFWFDGVIPYQAMGTLNEYNFYFRSRRCIARLSLSRGNNRLISNEVQWLAKRTLAEEDEFTTDTEFFELMIEFVQSLERAPFRYEFNGYKAGFDSTEEPPYSIVLATDEERVFTSWGDSSEDAYDNLFKPSQYLLENGFSSDFQQKIHEARRYSRTPNNTDTRIFLTEEPPNFFGTIY